MCLSQHYHQFTTTTTITKQPITPTYNYYYYYYTGLLHYWLSYFYDVTNLAILNKYRQIFLKCFNLLNVTNMIRYSYTQQHFLQSTHMLHGLHQPSVFSTIVINNNQQHINITATPTVFSKTKSNEQQTSVTNVTHTAETKHTQQLWCIQNQIKVSSSIHYITMILRASP